MTPKQEHKMLELIPPHMHHAMRDWIDNANKPGDFLTAVLENNLMLAFGFADEENRDALFDYCMFLRNYVPMGCHGSPERVQDWIKYKAIPEDNS